MMARPEINLIQSHLELPDDWDTYVNLHPQGRLFHSRTWLGMIAEVYRYQCHAFTVRDEQDKLTGILPLLLVRSRLTGDRLISAPFSYICGPLADNSETEQLLLGSARQSASALGLKYVEVKTDHRFSAPSEWTEVTDHFATYRLNLEPDPENLWQGLHKNMIQRGIKKAKRDGVRIEVSTQVEDSSRFDLLNRVTCRSHGIPAQPGEFFTAIWERLVKSGSADCLFALIDEKPVAGIVLFYDKKRAVYMYGASLPESLAARPNHLLLWEGLLRARQKGMTEFDFGRVSADNTTLAEFKKRWGATKVPLSHYYWPGKQGVGVVDRKSLKIRLSAFTFSHLPLGLTRRMSWLYRHLA